jgi:hypothetical protein
MYIALTLLLLALGGCSTPYQDMGFRGGVAAQRMTTDTYRIVARGNAYTGGLAIQDYTLLKAAETTKQAGATHFVIIRAADASRIGAFATPGQMQTSVVGNTAYTTYMPGMVHPYIKPGQDTYIQVFTIRAGQRPPTGVQSADEIIQFVGSRVKRPD